MDPEDVRARDPKAIKLEVRTLICITVFIIYEHKLKNFFSESHKIYFEYGCEVVLSQAGVVVVPHYTPGYELSDPNGAYQIILLHKKRILLG